MQRTFRKAVALGLALFSLPALLAPSLAQNQPSPKPVRATLPLAIIVDSVPGDLDQARGVARMQAEMQPKYKSGMLESLIFEGDFIPREPTRTDQPIELAVFSDDGVDVEVDGKRILNRFGVGQHLPTISASFHNLNGPDGQGAPWVPGRKYRIRIKYSNIIFTGNADIDGITLFAANQKPAVKKGPVFLESLSFTGGTTLEMDPVLEDAKTGKLKVGILGSPQWLDKDLDGTIDAKKGDHAYAYTYARGGKLVVSAEFAPVDKNFKGKEILLRASVSQAGKDLGIKIKMTTAKLAADGKFKLAQEVADKAFEKVVNVYEPLEIAWQSSTDGGKTWLAAGTSKNVIYLTFATPLQISQTSRDFYQTVFDIGSRGAAGYKGDSPTEAFDKIWKYFETLQVKRADGKVIGYYRDWHVPERTVEPRYLIAYADGECSGWSNLLILTASVQGLLSEPQAMVFDLGKERLRGALSVIPKAGTGYNGFLVKKWDFPKKEKPSYVDITSLNALSPLSFNLGKGNTYDFVGAPQVAPGMGIDGQGKTNPAKAFTNHCLFVLQAPKGPVKLYDPSYGKLYTGKDDASALLDFQEKALAGFFSSKPDAVGKTTSFTIVKPPAKLALQFRQ